jgi:ATP-dependent Clp protease ATP-binding subunit ClpB
MTDENADEIMGNLRVVLSELLRRTIRPEFLNRIDDVVLFKPLTKKEIRKIVEIQLSLVSKMLAEKEMKIVMDEDAKDWLAELGFDVAYGARPLKRTIQRYVINPLSQEILSGKFVDGDTIHISTGPRAGLEFRKA